jgi:hypothetical protein
VLNFNIAFLYLNFIHFCKYKKILLDIKSAKNFVGSIKFFNKNTLKNTKKLTLGKIRVHFPQTTL